MLGARVEALEASRAESDEMINTLSAEEFSKFAASDVADALKFVAGVNVVEGQFAIIRGLEDRYSSTLYNSAPIPSPDPDKQSVQLDLFASDIVSNLVVAKTFGAGSAQQLLRRLDQHPHARLPRRDRGEVPGRHRLQRERDHRLPRVQQRGSPVGTEKSGVDTIESDFAGSLGGRIELLGREIRFKGVLAREIDYDTAEGFLEGSEPRSPSSSTKRTSSKTITRSGSARLRGARC